MAYFCSNKACQRKAMESDGPLVQRVWHRCRRCKTLNVYGGKVGNN